DQRAVDGLLDDGGRAGALEAGLAFPPHARRAQHVTARTTVRGGFGVRPPAGEVCGKGTLQGMPAVPAQRSFLMSQMKSASQSREVMLIMTQPSTSARGQLTAFSARSTGSRPESPARRRRQAR